MVDTNDSTTRLAGRAALVSLGAALVICAVKFGGYYLTGSAAILSDALESVNNIMTALLVVYSLREAVRDADQKFFYGRGRIEYFSAGFEGGLIFLAGMVILYESLPRFRSPWTPVQLEAGMGLVLLASLLNGLLGWYLIRAGRRARSPALVADGQHVLTDLVTSAAVLVALGLVRLTGLVWLDPLVACGLALWLSWTGLGILRGSYFHLMDKVRPDLLEEVVSGMRAHRRDSLIYPHRLRLREIGPRLLLDLHSFVPRYFTVEETHELETGFARDLERQLGREVDFMMHIDPCRPDHCVLCAKPSCPVRDGAQEMNPTWSAVGLLSEPGEREGRDYPDLERCP